MCSDETPEGLPELERRIDLGSPLGWLPSIEPSGFACAGSLIDSSDAPGWEPDGFACVGSFTDSSAAPRWGPLIEPDGAGLGSVDKS